MNYQEITDVMTEQTERPAANIEARVERKRQRAAAWPRAISAGLRSVWRS